MGKISKFIFNKIGWEVQGITEYPDKCILCVAPHTSNWDFIIGKLAYTAIGKNASFLMKKTWFFFPLGIFLKALGGIPVDRSTSKKGSLTEQMVSEFSKRDKFQLAITPEGTRKHTTSWKKGFYYIAEEANVPIVIVIIDYKDKVVCFKDVFYPTGDVDADLIQIQSYYKNATGKNEENFSSNV